MTCSRCKNEATHQIGIPDPDLPMIPVCEEHRYIVYIELEEKMRKIAEQVRAEAKEARGK